MAAPSSPLIPSHGTRKEMITMFSKLEFFIGGYAGPSYSLTLQFQSGQLQEQVLLYDADFYRYHTAAKIIPPHQKIPLTEWLAQWDNLKLADWHPDYQDNDILDGSHWSLEYTENGVQHQSSGNNRYPKSWRKFLRWLHQRYPEIK